MYRKRFVAYLIDIIPITVITVMFFWFFMGFDVAFHDYIINKENIEIRKHFLEVRNQARDTAAILCFFYFVVFEYRVCVNTLGKFSCGLQVISIDGKRVTLMQSLLRNTTKLFSALTILAFLYPLFNKNRTFLHDKVAGTRVIKQG